MNWVDKLIYRLSKPRCFTPAGVSVLFLIGIALIYVVCR
jgi:hypothetical protein